MQHIDHNRKIGQPEAFAQVDQQIIRCLISHQFEKFGDVLDWWHAAPYDDKENESGEQGISEFSTDLLWLISLFGPDQIIDKASLPVLSKEPKRTKSTESTVHTTKKKIRRRSGY